MKVPDLSSSDAAASVQPVAGRPVKPPDATPETTSGGDQASVGCVALAASKLGTSEARIEELRKQYLEGTYEVDATQISAKIVDEHLSK